MSIFRRKPKPPPWPMYPHEKPGVCQVKMRAAGSISCWNGCDLTEGHEGIHRWSIGAQPSSLYPNGEHYEGTFTTEAAHSSWGRRASLEEMFAYEAGRLEGTTFKGNA